MKTIKKNNRISFQESSIHFRGNWYLPWVAQRYWRTALSVLTRKKLANAILAMAEMIFGKIKVRSKPVILRIEPTNVCQLRCPRCSCGIRTDPRKKGFMEIDDYRNILEQNKDNVLVVRLDGNGESTDHPKIFEMIQMAKTYNFTVSMSTHFNHERCEDIEKFIDSGLDRLIVSVDGATQESYEKYRVGGTLSVVEERVKRLLEIRRNSRKKNPIVEIQFLDWGYNHDEIPLVRQNSIEWGADKFEVISPDLAVTHAKANPKKPRRCFWLWFVLTIDWDLNYKSCTNAWTLPWARSNMHEQPMQEFWNSESMQQARQYNINKSSEAIASDPGCHCNACSDMLVVDRPPDYVCE